MNTTDVRPDQISATEVKASSISVRYQANISPDSKAPPNFYNRLRSCSNYPELTPRLPEMFPINTRAFEPSAVGSPGLSQILNPGLSLARLLGALSICTQKHIVLLFMIAFRAHPFYVKITVTGFS